MSLWDRILGETVDIIDWQDDTANTMVWRYPRYDNEIKYGAKLIVREGQAAVIVNEGELADSFGPGTYELTLANIPILSKLQNWHHGFESPFKTEVYFFSLRRFVDMKWGTKNPIMLRDREFGPVRLRAFGTYGVKIADPTVFLREIVGTDGHYTLPEISEQLRNLIVSRLAIALGRSDVPVLDLAANYDQLGDFIATRIADSLGEYGLLLTDLLVENVSLPKSVEQAMDRRTEMGVIGDLSRYTQFQTAEAMREAARNPGGAAGAGIGMGAGLAMGQSMAQSMQAGPAATASAPPPIPAGKMYHVARNGQQTGPFPAGELQSMIAAGGLGTEDLVWSPGMAAWGKASEQADLAAAFAATPPPLP